MADKKENSELKDKIAVVVIHGMGEQTPMGTMSDMVKSFLAYEEYMGYIEPKQNYYSVPSNLGDSFEVQQWIANPNDYHESINETRAQVEKEERKKKESQYEEFNKRYEKIKDDINLNVEAKRLKKILELKDARSKRKEFVKYKRPRTDFFELYWAPIMNDNKFSHVFPWMAKILFAKKKGARVNYLATFLLVILSLITVLPSLAFLSLKGCLPESITTFDMSSMKPLLLWIVVFAILATLIVYVLWIVGMILPLFSKKIGLLKFVHVLITGCIVGYAFIKFYNPIYKQIHFDEVEDGFVLSLVLGLIVSAIIFNFAGGLFKKFLADASRYFDPLPTNIENRDRIRNLGVKLIEDLTDSGKYDRIVILSHSLGSSVGYDILRLYWAKHSKYYKVNDPIKADLGSEDLEKHLTDNEIDEYQSTQHSYFKLLNESFKHKKFNGDGTKQIETYKPWLISDFITMGSPLSKIKLFCANGEKDDQWTKIKERTILTNPPDRDYVTEHYFYGSKNNFWLHHGALFAFTRWTNLYHKSDWIGGKISDDIGKGTKNICFPSYNTPPEESGEDYKKTPFNFVNWFISLWPFMHIHYWASDIKREPDSRYIDDPMRNLLIDKEFEKQMSFHSIREIYKAMHFDKVVD